MLRSAFRFLLLAAPLRFTCAKTALWEDFTEHDLESTIEENNRVLAVFSSRTFEPVQPFHQVLEKVASDPRLNTQIVLIDCDVEKELCRRYDVNEYPVIRLFKHALLGGEKTITRRYRGRKTEHGIRSFLTKHKYAIMSDVSSEDELRQFKNVDDVVIVGFLSGEWDEPTQIFHSIAEKYHEDFVFGYTYDKDSAEKEGITIPSVVCYKNTDGDHKILKGPFTEAGVIDFLTTAPKMVIGDFSERNMEAYMGRGKLSAYLFASTADEATSLRHELTPIAKKFEQYVTFGVADALEYGPMARNFGLDDQRFPALALHAPMNNNVFTYLQGRKILADVVEGMLMTILRGKATSGQAFGGEAPETEEREQKEREVESRVRDEL